MRKKKARKVDESPNLSDFAYWAAGLGIMMTD